MVGQELYQRILFEDNHLLAINKLASEIVQGDKTGDPTLPDAIKAYLKERDHKPGNVFCGVIHRLDRPTSGLVLFAKTSKALERMNTQFREKEIEKTYLALVEGSLEGKGTLVNHLRKNEKQNKSYVVDQSMGKEARLRYEVIQAFNHYSLVRITLETGRHHQIRCQFAHLGFPIKGDLKYGAKRSNKDGSIGLHASTLSFNHPTTKERIWIEAPPISSDWIQ
ncbi:MAG: RluA family pseudouridine synthase [Crocinitomicaceae bacterium]|jgi:23S rRNA pseudouridine1911/1915/1917 synthase